MTLRETLVIAAHGTRSQAGLATIEEIADRVRIRRPGISVHVGYLDVAVPTLAETLARVHGPACVVPLLLGHGYHASVDIPTVVGTRPSAAVTAVTPVLGADPRLVDALVDRLAEVRTLTPDDTVILAAAGSRDPRSASATESLARLLARRIDAPVDVAYAAARSPRAAEAVDAVRGRGRRPVLATLLLAPGYFADVIAAAGADAVTAPLGGHPAIVDLVLARYDAARQKLLVDRKPCSKQLLQV